MRKSLYPLDGTDRVNSREIMRYLTSAEILKKIIMKA
jgi:hypothetical protein